MNTIFYIAVRKVGAALAALSLSLASFATLAQITTYYHNDPSGTPQVATDVNGNVVWKESYRPYGDKLNNQPGAGTNKIGYAGRPYDNSTGLSYMGARYYDPVIGRFTGVDPADQDAENVHSLNRYTYANNNPYRYIDPDGNTPVDALFLFWDLGKLGVAIYVGNPAAIADAGVDAAISFASVFSPVPGVGQAYKVSRITQKGLAAANQGENAVQAASLGSAAAKVHPTFKPGPHAGESIPARGPGRDFTAHERAEGKRIFSETGCHTCGTKTAGTKRNDPVLDHQPVSALNTKGAPQRLYPQCLKCSKNQGLAVIRQLREDAKK
ncbi:RHS repeat domain-containing protein [Piscinibacter sp. HJYY11]|uniref:RHS repeat domain-containing protein n=1 Tax=Piscinibacter sp. HJYY11 TaxID=2801333 RepID=UPI00191DC135|nr:RHS repeat-associated core domain-containing protein [Piscinibacter sp. HJYY11]MBL0729590.1 RHS domain-containing protein [Piscinibacter sp. HJYY11]